MITMKVRIPVNSGEISYLRLRLSSEGGVVHLETLALHHSDVRWDSVAKLHLDDVAQSELLGLHTDLVALPESQSVLGHHVSKGFHDLG